MAKKIKFGVLMCFAALGGLSFMIADWGFYAHRKINYYAVLTVPPPLNQFLKPHIHYLSTQAVGPDQRRYAVPGEGPRHFIDLDRWMSGDSLILTQDYVLDRILQGEWTWKSGDTQVSLTPGLAGNDRITFHGGKVQLSIDSFALRQEVYGVAADSIVSISPSFYPDHRGELVFADSLTSHGIVPYHVEKMYHVLVRQMMEKDLESVLRTCADLGHYISDAHVPLHTTSNYNGQFTDQTGIHAFWESRIPELFEESEFNSLVGRAEYIDDIHDFIWGITKHSYSQVPIVLEKEREARLVVEAQHQYCYEERGNTMVRTQCPALAREYMERMDGMVQDQWRAAIRAVGSVWYSAWIDAGHPDLWSGAVVSFPDTGLIDRIRNFIDRSGSGNRSELH